MRNKDIEFSMRNIWLILSEEIWSEYRKTKNKAMDCILGMNFSRQLYLWSWHWTSIFIVKYLTCSILKTKWNYFRLPQFEKQTYKFWPWPCPWPRTGYSRVNSNVGMPKVRLAKVESINKKWNLRIYPMATFVFKLYSFEFLLFPQTK